MINAFLRKVYFNIIHATVPNLKRRVGDQLLWPFSVQVQVQVFLFIATELEQKSECVQRPVQTVS